MTCASGPCRLHVPTFDLLCAQVFNLLSLQLWYENILLHSPQALAARGLGPQNHLLLPPLPCRFGSLAHISEWPGRAGGDIDDDAESVQASKLTTLEFCFDLR